MRARLVAALVAAALPLSACGGEPRPTLGPEQGTGPAPSSTVALPQIGDVHAAIRRGLSSLQSFRAEVLGTTSGASRETRVTVERTARGLMKDVEATPGVERIFFDDGQEGRHVFHYAPESGRPTARVQTGVPVGVRTGYGSPLPARGDPVALARQVLDWDDARVSRDTVDGRAAWVVQRSTPGVHPELQVVTIDDQTGLALRFDALQGGQPEYQVQVENLATNLDAEPSYALPGGTTLYRGDMGHVRMTLEQAGRAAGLAPLVPEWLPPGFTQAEVAATTSDARGPRRISVAFRRGMDVIVLHVTPGPVAPPAPGITIARGERDPEGNLSVPRREERRRLSAGVLAGVEAELSFGRTSGLSAADEARLVHLSGDVTIEDLMRVAESLQPAR